MATTARLTLRPATADDAELLLRWANDPLTRAASFHPRPIAAETHRAWLARLLESGAGRLWIGMIDDRAIGQVRFDPTGTPPPSGEARPPATVEVSISVAPEARGRGCGRALLAAGLAEARRHGARRFVAYVRPENAVSVALFRGAGFRLAGRGERHGVACLAFRRP